jgi:hypothetical protein
MAPNSCRSCVRSALRSWVALVLLGSTCSYEPALPSSVDASVPAERVDAAVSDRSARPGAADAVDGSQPRAEAGPQAPDAAAAVPDAGPPAPPDAATPAAPDAALLTPPTPEQTAFGCPPDPALRACYSFDEAGDAITDRSGQGNHGMRNSAEVTAGVRTMALRFADGQGFAIVPDAPSLQLSGTSATFEAWIRPTASAMDGRVDFIAGKWTRGNLGYLFGLYDRKLSMNRSGGTGSRSEVQLKLMTWAHLAVVLTASEVIMYVDGTRVMAAPTTALDLPPNTEPLTLGNRNPAQNMDAPALTAFYGDLDVLRIYARSKRPEEICADAGRAYSDGLCIGTLITPQ